MRIVALTVAWNAERFIGPAIQQLQPYVERHLVHLSKRPWVGESEPPDRTQELIRSQFPQAELWQEEWPDETCQRNQGLGRLRWADWVWIVDADEYYTASDIEKILEVLARREADVYIIQQKSYWKTPEWRWEPPDTWPPAIILNPKHSYFFRYRAVVQPLEECRLLDGVTMHHFNYVRTDAELRSKLAHFSHQADIRPEWWQAWQNWTPGQRVNVFPYRGGERVAVYDPAPEEIASRFTQWQKILGDV